MIIGEAIAYNDAIQPLNTLANRFQKRRYEQEALRIVKPLEEINTSFLYELFDEDNRATYKALYEKWLELWLDTVADICKTRNIKYVGIDIQWFSRNYRPRERG
jgi:hypothetical protein